jgi:hypothetical protein
LFPHVTFVPFPQSSQVDNLSSILADPRYVGRKKVLITLGLNIDERMLEMIERNKEIFENVIPLNIGTEWLDKLTSHDQKPFQKGILAIGLLASAIPKDQHSYKTVRSYAVLEALLNMIFEDRRIVSEYIGTLVNPGNNINEVTRWGYLISRLIGPVKRHAINVFMHIVSYFA